jgi:hypothetical protein
MGRLQGLRYGRNVQRSTDAWKTAALLRIQQAYYNCCSEKVVKDSPKQKKVGFDVVDVDVGGPFFLSSMPC